MNIKFRLTAIAAITCALAFGTYAQSAKSEFPLFWVREDGKYGYIDKTGKTVIAPQFENTMGFSEGLAATKLNGKYGYIDTKGKWVIPPQFEFTYKFSDGLAMVRTGKSYSWIDRKGRTVIAPREFEEVATGFSEGRLAVKKDGKWGYINREGNLVVDANFKKATAFKGGLAQVETHDGMHHWVAADGRIVWSQKPNTASEMSHGKK
jgi:hypothetical protein